MKPSSAKVRPRVEVVYEPDRSAASHSDTSATWKIRAGTPEGTEVTVGG